MGKLDGQVALVTGGGRGIGAAICNELAREGAKVGIGYGSSAAAAGQLAQTIAAAGGEALALPADVRDTAAVEAAIRAVSDRWGRLDLLVNNAAIVRDTLLLTMEDAQWAEVLDVNLSGMFRACRAAGRIMLLQRSGCIVNLSSTAASRPNRGQANYAAAKGGVESLTRALAAELGRKGIRVNAVAPGVIVTEMSARIREAAGEEIRKEIVLRRFGTSEEVARVVTFLASPDAAYITGEVIHVDGGLRL